MTILGWRQTQFQKKNYLAFIEGHHTSWFPTDQRSFLMDAARCRPPRSYPETGLRKVSGHVYWASCRNPEVVRSRHHGISNEKSAWGKRGAVECRPSSEFRQARFWITSALPTTRSEPVNEHFDRWQLLRIGFRTANPIFNE